MRRLALVLLVLFLSANVMAAEKPNIVLIMADDFGVGSSGCYGAPPELVKTPAIDRLAREGVRFTNASTPSSICSPTRYGVLMGRYPWRTRMKFGVVNVNDPLLPDPKRTSLAKWLQEQGYTTAAVGKWHLGYGTKANKSPEDWTGSLKPGAIELGFDYHFAIPQNHGDITGVYVENDGIYGLESNKVFPYSKSFYGKPYFGFDAPQRVNKSAMETLTDKAVDWLEASGDKPFFLFFTPVGVHHPITPSDRMRGESGCGPYGDFIQDVDLSVQRILDTLDKMGVADNTMVVFTADNGGDIPTEATRPECAAMALGLKSNGDMRGDKHTIWEGGLRVPYIVRWPDKAPAGTVSDTMINLMDTYATVADIVGEKFIAPDSYSFLKTLMTPQKPGGSTRTSMVVSNAQGILALRQGDWKYIEGAFPETWPENRRNSDYEGQAVRQLYNLKTDPGEQKNVIDRHPELADELQQELDKIRG